MDSPLPETSIVMANWNGRGWLEQCLPTMLAQSYRDFELIIVDNGSTDDSVAWLQENWPQVRLLVHPANRGFAAANNDGIRLARGRYIATLNNDTLLAPDWLKEVVAAAERTNAGMVASHIVRRHDPGVLDSTGITVDWSGTAWNRGWGKPAAGHYAGEVFGPSGAAALYRRAMLDEIGLFDGDFFAYYEDVDLAWRAQNAGWYCRYSAAACLQHHHSATGGRLPAQKLFLIGRNKIWTILKNYPWPDLFYMWPLIVATEVTAVVYHSLRHGHLVALRARLAALRQARRMIARRRPIRQRARLQPPLGRDYQKK
jgi:GT2 family glycosyltransferase